MLIVRSLSFSGRFVQSRRIVPLARGANPLHDDQALLLVAVDCRPCDLRESHPVEHGREVMLEQVLVEIACVGFDLDRVLG
jgi:hypothetical protein